MNDKFIKKLIELVKEGKITDNEMRELVGAMSFEKSDELKLGLPKEIECHCFGSVDLELSGDDSINEVIIDEGKDYLKADMQGETLRIHPKDSGIRFFQHELHHAGIRLPQNFPSVDVKLVSGDLCITNLISKFNISLVSGDVNASNIKGDLDIEALSGDIRLENYVGELDINTKSGDIDISNSKLKGTLKTYSGDISIKDGELGLVKATTFNGDIKIDKANFKGNGDINTYFGDVSLNADLSDVNIISETSFGDVTGNKKERAEKSKESAYEINIKTKSGDIHIKETGEQAQSEVK